jgi:opacity protein-like surface antigen
MNPDHTLFPKVHMRSLRSVLAVAAVVVATPLTVSAQVARPSTSAPSASVDGGFKVGDKLVSLGVLAGGDGYEGFGAGGAFEYGLLELTPRIRLGVGGSAGYMRDANNGLTVSQIPLYGIGNFHFAIPSQPKLDLYAGASLGITRTSVSFSGTVLGRVKGSTNNSGFGIQGGAHYQVSDALTVMGQIGVIDIPLLFAGVGFKF